MHKKVFDDIQFSIKEIDKIFTEYEVFFMGMDYSNPDLGIHMHIF